MDTRTKENQPFALRFNSGKIDWTIIDFPALKPLVDVLMYGEHKYSTFENIETGEQKTGQHVTREEVKVGWKLIISGRDNWKMGFSVRELQKSTMRHKVAMLSGELNDSESGCPHVGHVMANELFISYYTTVPEGIEKRLDKPVKVVEYDDLPF